MLKIFDASLNSYAPKHRTLSLGPKENDLMYDLKKYSSVLGVEFVFDYRKADRIITNTTYTPEIIIHANKKSIPLIKRMDGVFWRNDLIERNIPLNSASLQSDAVIFISKFSQDSFHTLYPDQTLKKEFVVLNNVDESIFKQNNISNNYIKTWGTSATNWDRSEKRPNVLLLFADLIHSFGEKLIIIGKSDIEHPCIINKGYFNDYTSMSEEINKVDAWINFSYMDAAPKTVLQAIKCGKPVLYADSGGVSELVNNFGLAIPDNNIISFSNDNHDLYYNDILTKYTEFKELFTKQLFDKPIHKPYIDTLQEYVNIIKNV